MTTQYFNLISLKSFAIEFLEYSVLIFAFFMFFVLMNNMINKFNKAKKSTANVLSN